MGHSHGYRAPVRGLRKWTDEYWNSFRGDHLSFGFRICDRQNGQLGLPFIGSIGLLFAGAILAFWMKPDQALAGAELLEYASPEKAVV